MALRWRCLEPGCGAAVQAPSDQELVEAANAHVRKGHGSYELEEVILAGAERDTADRTTISAIEEGSA